MFNNARVMMIFVISFITVDNLAQNLKVKTDRHTDTVLHLCYKIIVYKPTAFTKNYASFFL